MPKNIFFGIWEFIFSIIVIAIAILFVWPAISNYMENDKQQEYDKIVQEIIAAATKYVELNPQLYSVDGYVYKVTLNELEGAKLLKLPIKNKITNKNFDAEYVHVNIIKYGEDYDYKLVITSSYKDALKLSSQKIKVGDYVSYPIEYINYDASGIVTQQAHGWRILTVNGDTIKIVSGGQPVAYIAGELDQTYKDLTNKANYNCNAQSVVTSAAMTCFGNYVDLRYVSDNATTINDEDLLGIALSSDLRTTGSSYWVLTNDESKLRYVDYDGNSDAYNLLTIGVRPVLTLRDDVKTTGKVNDEWQLIVK